MKYNNTHLIGLCFLYLSISPLASQSNFVYDDHRIPCGGGLSSRSFSDRNNVIKLDECQSYSIFEDSSGRGRIASYSSYAGELGYYDMRNISQTRVFNEKFFIIVRSSLNGSSQFSLGCFLDGKVHELTAEDVPLIAKNLGGDLSSHNIKEYLKKRVRSTGNRGSYVFFYEDRNVFICDRFTTKDDANVDDVYDKLDEGFIEKIRTSRAEISESRYNICKGDTLCMYDYEADTEDINTKDINIEDMYHGQLKNVVDDYKGITGFAGWHSDAEDGIRLMNYNAVGVYDPKTASIRLRYIALEKKLEQIYFASDYHERQVVSEPFVNQLVHLVFADHPALKNAQIYKDINKAFPVISHSQDNSNIVIKKSLGDRIFALLMRLLRRPSN